MRRLYRSRYNKKISGLCGGVGHYFRIDPNIIRLIFVFVTLIPIFFFGGLLFYCIASIVVPKEPENAPAVDYRHCYRANNERLLFGVCFGVARFIGIDPTLFRLIFVAACLLTAVAPLLITYVVAAFILPSKNF